MGRFGITLEVYRALIAQGCTICGTKEDVVLDHKEKIRGPLCRAHNSMLGLARDDPMILQRAIVYLKGC